MVYLDYNATSPPRPQVRQAVAPFLEEEFGNPSSVHAKGRQARDAVEKVRSELLRALGDPGGMLIFTSGGTEADNLALTGLLRFPRRRGNHLLVSAVEHHAVLHTADALVEEGVEVEFIRVDRCGRVDLEDLKRKIRPTTVLISVMQANNEVGTVQPVRQIGRIAKENGVLFHTDAVQSFGKIPLDVRQDEVDLASFSAHKLGGLKGTGALYVRRGVPFRPLLRGGPQEHQLRGGTEGVPGIVGMGAAAQASLKEREEGTTQRIQQLRDRLEEGLRAIPGAQVHGHSTDRLPGTLNVSFSGCRADSLLMALDLAGICVSSGSACSSGSTEPSHVLLEMGLAPEQVQGSIRFSLGWGTTEAEIQECLGRIPPIVERVRNAG